MWWRRRTRHVENQVNNETISIRAYQLWEARGCPESSGTEDWQAAKAQLDSEAQRSGRGRPLRRLLARLRNRAA